MKSQQEVMSHSPCCQRVHAAPAARHQPMMWAPLGGQPSFSPITCFDDQISMQDDLLQNQFFGVPEIGCIVFDPLRKSKLLDALLANDAAESEIKFHENPKKHQIQCQVHTGCGDFFRPEDIELNVKDRNVEFKARREQKSEDGHNYTMREVRRVFNVPENAEIEKLQAEMGLNGKIMLTAPLSKPKAVENKSNKPVPIKINGV